MFNNPSMNDQAFQTPFQPTQQLGYETQFGEPDLLNVPMVQGMAPDHRFNENIINHVSDGELNRIGEYLTNSINSDDTDRQKWLRILTQGIEQLGLGVERASSTSGGKDTDLYATTLLTECLKITCKLFSIFFPGRKFAETKIYGYVNKAIEDKSYRCSEFFDYYTNDVMTEYLPDSEQSLWWSVLGGSSFVKPYFDPHKGRIVAPYIMPQNIIISSGASSVYDAERVTHRFTLTKRQMEANFEKGIWIKRLVEENTQYVDSVTRKVNQVVGVEPTANENNENYMFDECYTYVKITGFEEMDKHGNTTPRYMPYRIIKDKNSNKIVGIWRNWNENDVLFRPKIAIIQHKYFTGFNAYGLGMIHLALGSSKTETKIQQQIIKGAVLSNMPNLIQKSGMRTEQNQLNFTPGKIPQVASFGEPLQNMFMPMPFTPPQQIMMDLKNSCAMDIQNISIAREIKADAIPANTSATTILGILSTTNDMPNSLIKSYCRSFTKEFQLIFDLLGEILPEEGYPFLTPGGSQSIMKHDFSPDVKIKPIMDPSNSSQTMQMLTNEILMTLAGSNPDMYNQREVQKRILNTLKIDDLDTLLTPEPEEQEVPRRDAVSENACNMQGLPIKVFKDQDHKSHIAVHNDEIQRLSADQSKDNTKPIAALTAHVTEHEMWQYILEMEGAIGQPIPDDPSQLSPEMQEQLSMHAAQAIQAKQQQQQQDNPPPMDPSIPLMEENRVKEKGIELESQYKQEQLRTEHMKIEKDSQMKELDIQMKMKQLEMEDRKLMIEERRLVILEQENERKNHLEMAKLQLDQQKADLQAESKAFSDTLRYENDSNKDIEIAKLEADKRKSDLLVESKAFDTVMTHESAEHSEQTNNK
jgi:hypothetical protein